MKKLLLLLFIPTLCCCVDNPPITENKFVKDFGTISNTNISFSIGADETKYVPINLLFNCIMDEYDLTYEFVNSYLNKEVVQFNIFDNNGENIDTIFNYSFIGNKLYYSAYAFKLNCRKPFQNDISISYFEIETSTSIFKIGIEMTVTFNKDYINYPKLLPSYYADEGTGRWFWKSYEMVEPWLFNVISDRALVFDFSSSNLEDSKIVFNDITFSSNLNQFIECKSYTKFTKSEAKFWANFARSIDSMSFNAFDEPVDFNDYINSGEALMFYANKKIDTDKFIVGDVIYDMTIDGENYLIKDMFILYGD